MTTFEDFEAITRLRYHYAMGLDTRDWALLRSIFTDEIHMDFESYSGAPGNTLSADAWIAGTRVLFTGLDSSQHVMTNPVVEVDGGGIFFAQTISQCIEQIRTM